VLRFWNNEVLQNREGVLETILAHASRPSSGPSGHLLPEGEGERCTPPCPKDEGLGQTVPPEPFSPREKVDARSAAG
jgi:hypothetical protein